MLRIKKFVYPIFGLASYLPGFASLMKVCGRANKSRFFITGTDGAHKARYCYSVYLRHLVKAHQNGMTDLPARFAEIGPGESFGIGLAALLAGAEKYLAFDVIEHANLHQNISVFDELVELFRKREAIPANDEYPEVMPRLECYDFPSEILSDKVLNASLDNDRIAHIKASISNCHSPDSMIDYVVPWGDASQIDKGSIDLVFSQAVMEHADDLPFTYHAIAEWIKPGGFMSHQIDFRCHGTSDTWNGHWAYSERTWKMMVGNRKYLLNREPHSKHLELLEANHFHIVCDEVMTCPSELSRDELSDRCRSFSDADLITSAAFIQSKRMQNVEVGGLSVR